LSQKETFVTRYALAFVAALSLAAAPALAGKFNKKLNIGDAAPTFSGLEGVDGKTYSLDTFKDKDVVVVVVTCNHCPVAQAYQDRLIAFAKKHAGPDSKVGFIAINVNNLPEDKLDKMKERAKEKGFTFPYVYDPSQKIGRALGATVTPEFFVLNKERKIVYMGAMDDDMDADKAKVNYLEAAVTAALKGEQPPMTETAGRGCSIQYEPAGK
jgi:peroxiredoxin